MINKDTLKEAVDYIDALMKKEAAEKKEMEKFLIPQLRKIEKIDSLITWHEKKIKEQEVLKQVEIEKMRDLLDLAVMSSFSLKNGFTIMEDNRMNLEVTDVATFLKWLKQNCEPQEVLDFFANSLKKASLKRFCEKQFNKQREAGSMEPKIDGVNFGEQTFSGMTTLYRKVKDEKRKGNQSAKK